MLGDASLSPEGLAWLLTGLQATASLVVAAAGLLGLVVLWRKVFRPPNGHSAATKQDVRDLERTQKEGMKELAEAARKAAVEYVDHLFQELGQRLEDTKGEVRMWKVESQQKHEKTKDTLRKIPDLVVLAAERIIERRGKQP